MSDPIRAQLADLDDLINTGGYVGTVPTDALRAVLDECEASMRDTRYPGLVSAIVIRRAIAEKLGS